MLTTRHITIIYLVQSSPNGNRAKISVGVNRENVVRGGGTLFYVGPNLRDIVYNI